MSLEGMLPGKKPLVSRHKVGAGFQCGRNDHAIDRITWEITESGSPDSDRTIDSNFAQTGLESLSSPIRSGDGQCQSAPRMEQSHFPEAQRTDPDLTLCPLPLDEAPGAATQGAFIDGHPYQHMGVKDDHSSASQSPS